MHIHARFPTYTRLICVFLCMRLPQFKSFDYSKVELKIQGLFLAGLQNMVFTVQSCVKNEAQLHVMMVQG